MATTATPGLVLELNEKEVCLSPKDATTDPSRPAHFELADRVELGSLTDLAGFVNTNFGVSTLPDWNKLPAPLNTMGAKLASLNMAVEKFAMTVPPSKKSDGTDIPPAEKRATSFNLGLSATWADPIVLVQGSLSIKGVYLQVVKDDAP
ncbi:MAG: hypothetical protein AMXMBFR53_29070 [Gemmatimonadota bacterium]